MNCSRVYHHHHRLHLTHLYNSNNAYLHIAKQPFAERPVSLFSLAKLLVLLLILLWLLLLMRKAEHEVQDRQALARTNFSTGRPSSWTPRASSTSTRSATPAPPSAATSNRDTRKQAQPPLSAKSTPAGPAQSSASSM